MLNKDAAACVNTKRAIFAVDKTNLNITTMAYVISDDCVACGTCIDECPQGAISEGEKYSINPELCVDCGCSASVCPSEAIHEG
jgi:ferredoxin